MLSNLGYALGQQFSERLLEDFQREGAPAIVRLRETRPADYLRIVTALVPRQIELRAGPFDTLLDGDLADLVSSVTAALAEA